uniref:Uncharacterized protein n=1 Tax=Panagrolaimus sp. ES5 TaxID=591445 RepID=A0AC34FZC8_9BILA
MENLLGFIDFEEKIVKFCEDPDLKRHEKCWRQNSNIVNGAIKVHRKLGNSFKGSEISENECFSVKNDEKILKENQNSEQLLKNVSKRGTRRKRILKSSESECYENSVPDEILQQYSYVLQPEPSSKTQGDFIQIQQQYLISEDQMPQFCDQQQQYLQSNEYKILLPHYLHHEYYVQEYNYYPQTQF